jgi:hypothetical protein
MDRTVEITKTEKEENEKMTPEKVEAIQKAIAQSIYNNRIAIWVFSGFVFGALAGFYMLALYSNADLLKFGIFNISAYGIMNVIILIIYFLIIVLLGTLDHQPRDIQKQELNKYYIMFAFIALLWALVSIHEIYHIYAWVHCGLYLACLSSYTEFVFAFFMWGVIWLMSIGVGICLIWIWVSINRIKAGTYFKRLKNAIDKKLENFKTKSTKTDIRYYMDYQDSLEESGKEEDKDE